MPNRRTLPVLAAAAVAASLLVGLPGTAYAVPVPVDVPVADAVDALHAIDTASLTAAAGGFTETTVFNAEPLATLQFDPVAKIRLLVVPLGGGPVVKQLDTPTADCQLFERDGLNRAAVRLAGLPLAEWVCRSVPSNPDYDHDLGVADLFADTNSAEPAPGGLPEVVDSATLLGTATDGTWHITSHEGGNAGVVHRTYTATIVGGKVMGVELDIAVDTAQANHISDTIVYAAPTPTLTMPARASMISASRLALARDAVTLRQRMARYATSIADNANAYAVKRSRATLVRDVAGWARVILARNPSGLVAYQSARTGVVLYGRNPFSRERVSYSVLVAHGRAAVHRVA